MSIRYGLLSLLSHAPAHGYQLRADFEAVTGATWSLNIGQVYTTLQRLERDGLIVDVDGDGGSDPDGHDDRRRYALTARGEEELRRWFTLPVPREAPPRNELVIKLVLTLLLPDVDTQSVIDIQRQATMRGLQALIRTKKATQGDVAASLVAESAIFNAEAEIRWLDHCEARLVKPAKGVPT